MQTLTLLLALHVNLICSKNERLMVLVLRSITVT